MDASGYWEQLSYVEGGPSMSSGQPSMNARFFDDDDDDSDDFANRRRVASDDSHNNLIAGDTSTADHPNLDQTQKIYYKKGLEELDSLQLLDLSPLANWKLSSFKPGFGLDQLRDDLPDTFWQSDGSNGNPNANANSIAMANNQLTHPHSITIQFAKKVLLERISIFTNFLLDESYTPSKIRIMAGSSDSWDLTEVCTVSFNKPVGWSHIIFNGIRGDGVLKCFIVKIVILANHQDGKDSHIRAIRCFGKKTVQLTRDISAAATAASGSDILRDMSLVSGMSNLSGVLLNHQIMGPPLAHSIGSTSGDGGELEEEGDDETQRILGNVNDVIGLNSGFQSVELRLMLSIR